MDSLAVEPITIEDDTDTKLSTPDYRYFEPVDGESSRQMLRRLDALTPELPHLLIERASTGEVVLRAGALRQPLQKRGSTPDDLMGALNVLLDKSQVRERYVELRPADGSRSFAFTSMDEILDKLNAGDLAAGDLSELIELTGW
jgi:hypothetical protein